ncbi:MAG: hypothetical protein V4620_02230 [Bacteroidota bacterium]
MKKNILLITAFLAGSFYTNAQSINFEADQLYPEGIAYNKITDEFLVSSLKYGKIGKVNRDGTYTTFITDSLLISTNGLHVDNKTNTLFVCVTDPGVSPLTSTKTQLKLAKVIAYDLTDGHRKFVVDLQPLNKDNGNFANDITADTVGNLYVTNSLSPIIFKINKKGVPSIFASSQTLWKQEGFNLNGIVYHPNGFLIVAQSNTGILYKVDCKDPNNIRHIMCPPIEGADGLVLNGKNELLVISNKDKKVFKLVSNSDWTNADQIGSTDCEQSGPTTGVYVKGSYYVLNAKLNELFDPTQPKSKVFTIQEIKF